MLQVIQNDGLKSLFNGFSLHLLSLATNVVPTIAMYWGIYLFITNEWMLKQTWKYGRSQLSSSNNRDSNE
jgi:hypothetical protein